MAKYTSTDVMHLYLNCPFRFVYKDGTTIFGYVRWVNIDTCMFDEASWILDNGEIRKPLNSDEASFEILDLRKEGRFDLILHHPCDISKEMKSAYKSLCYKINDLYNLQKVIRYSDTPLSIKYMFDNGIDAFDLIENKYALDIKNFDFLLKQNNEQPTRQ